MGLFRPKRKEVAETRTALQEAADGHRSGAIEKVIDTVLAVGIDGRGPLKSASAFAESARRGTRDVDAAIKKILKTSTRRGAAGGFVTGLGGFVTMPVALPANVLEFYVQAVRMIAAVAHLRGYDLTDDRVRTAILLTLTGSDADDVLKKAGVTAPGGQLASFALRRLPPAALMIVNKAVGFRLLRGVGEKFLTRLGKGVPFVGGFLGAGLDAWMMSRIGRSAKKEFPPIETVRA
ncbi:EcsC family protein [Naumannella halotolerans]